ncbi:MAG: hypothetical protein GXY50_06550 [Syntrophomonadaceae bacterium]|nr:hypothetical protein [Syntrophomonadaceae bacterium]
MQDNKDNSVENAINEIRSTLERGEAIEVRPLPHEPPAFEMDLMKAWRILLANWKRIVLITLVCGVIGAIGGAIYYVTPKSAPEQQLDFYTGVEINTEDSYGEAFSNAGRYRTEITAYIDGLYRHVSAGEYEEKENDKEYLITLKEDINEVYADTFLYAKKLADLYSPVRDDEIEEKLITLELRQKELTQEIQCLQQELYYLSGIAGAGVSTMGAATDAAIAQGVGKARSLANYQQELQNNLLLINSLLNEAGDSQREQHMERIENLLDQGIAANQGFEQELNQFAEKYFHSRHISIIVAQTPDEGNPDFLNYVVRVEDARQQASPLRIPQAITLLFLLGGLGLGCVWVLWKHYKPDDNRMNG